MRQVLRPGALRRPRGMGWGGRWEGGSGWGTHVNPWLIHVNVWQTPLQYCKVISLQLIKINAKKFFLIKKKYKLNFLYTSDKHHTCSFLHQTCGRHCKGNKINQMMVLFPRILEPNWSSVETAG